MTINADFDVKQLVLTGSAFGPREIEQLRDGISRDVRKYDELKEAINELKSKDDDELSPATCVKFGVCLFLVGDFDASLEFLKKGDGGALAQFYFAKLHFVKHEYDDAIEAYNVAQKAGYNPDDCVLGRAEVYREAGKLEESLHELDSLNGAATSTPEYNYQRAATVKAFGNTQEAINLYEKVLETYPDHTGALFGLALENERRGNDQEALDLYRRATRFFPPSVGALVNLGILYEDMRMYESARQCFQRVLDYDPLNKRARLFLKDVQASNEVHVDEEELVRQRELGQKLSQPLSDFDLPSRARSVFNEMNVNTLFDLCQLTEQQLLNVKNFGETTLEKIKEILAERDLRLGMFSAEKQRADVIDDSQLSPEEQNMLARPVSELNLSVRARKCMSRLNIVTIRDLVSRSADELLDARNFGQTSLNEIREKLGELNLHLKGDAAA